MKPVHLKFEHKISLAHNQLPLTYNGGVEADNRTFSNLDIVLHYIDVPQLVQLLKEKKDFPSKGLLIRFLNAWSIVQASNNQEFQKCLSSPGINFIDSLPMFVLQKLISGKELPRKRGSDFMRAFLACSPSNLEHTFIVSNEKTANQLEQTLTNLYPAIHIKEILVPPILENPYEMSDYLTNCFESRSYGVYWVGIGSPKQELVSQLLSATFEGCFVSCGAAIEFIAGTKKESPKLFQDMGLEWLYRFIREPRRLGKRYLVGNSQFILIALKLVLKEFFSERN